MMKTCDFWCLLVLGSVFLCPTSHAQTLAGQEYRSIADMDARWPAAQQAGIAAGEAVIAPYKEQLADYRNPGAVAAAAAIAYPLLVRTVSFATCQALALHPETCIDRTLGLPR